MVGLVLPLDHIHPYRGSRPWLRRTCYIAVVLYIVGFVVLGASVQNHLSVGALVMGWGIAEVAVMINTVAVCESSPFARIPGRMG